MLTSVPSAARPTWEQKLPTAAALKSKNSNWPAPEMLQWATGSAKIIQKNMRLHVLSDLHQEFAPYRSSADGADVIILAGDTHTGLNGIRWAQKEFDGRQVVYIAGNHEYYGKNLRGHLQHMRETAAGTNVHFLEQNTLEIGEVTFLGATLWTDLNFFGNVPLAEIDAARDVNDYKKIHIEPKYRRLRPRDLVPVHKETLTWLGQQLEELKGKKVVVITHHGISRKSVPDHFMGGPSQPAYTSELTEFVLGHPCKLWIHGHTLWAFDYRLGETRVLANPRGYPHETTHGFNPKLIVEV